MTRVTALAFAQVAIVTFVAFGCGESQNSAMLEDVTFRSESVSDDVREAAAAVVAFYRATDSSECPDLVTSEVQSLCAQYVPLGTASPDQVEDTAINEAGDCAQIIVGFSGAEGTNSWNVEKHDSEWRVGVSDDFGDDQLEPCDAYAGL